MKNPFALPPTDGTGLGPKLTSLLYREKSAARKKSIVKMYIQMMSLCVSASIWTMSKVSRSLLPSPLSSLLLLPAHKGSSLAFGFFFGGVLRRSH